MSEQIEEALGIIEILQESHQTTDYCSRLLRKEYGGPKSCSECDKYNRLTEILEEIR